VVKNEEKLILATDPFAAGRTEAAERYGHLAKNAAQWRRISLVLLLCCAACVFAVIQTANRVTVVPYIVQVDQHGYQIAVEPVKPSKVDNRLIISTVARYVWSMKTVFSDAEAQLYLMNFVYNTTPATTAAEIKYQDYYRKNNPMDARATRISVHAIVNSVLPLSEKTWQAEWTEDSFQDGRKLWSKHYRGIFETTINAPKNMDEILVNSLGIYITDFNFSEIIGGQDDKKQ
jgi:type IV secretion system protein VirB5